MDYNLMFGKKGPDEVIWLSDVFLVLFFRRFFGTRCGRITKGSEDLWSFKNFRMMDLGFRLILVRTGLGFLRSGAMNLM